MGRGLSIILLRMVVVDILLLVFNVLFRRVGMTILSARHVGWNGIGKGWKKVCS